jgi:dephospho-CoA kinase
MIRVAVVGDIGSGKSYIARLFGYPIFNADDEVAKLYKKNRRCFNKLKKALPKYIQTFPVNKSSLSQAIIENNYNLKKIINIIHPEIRMKMKQFIKKNKNKKMVILDIPLLIENKMNKKKDILIFVEASKKEINKRLAKRDNANLGIFKKFKKLQLPIELKKKKSNYIVKNNFKNNFVKKNVKIIVRNILLNA